MGDWFIATEGVKIVKDSPGLWPQIITAVASIGAALGGVGLTHRFTRKREQAAAEQKLAGERYFIATELVFKLEDFAEMCAEVSQDDGRRDEGDEFRPTVSVYSLEFDDVTGDWRALPPPIMYRVREMSVLQAEARGSINFRDEVDTSSRHDSYYRERQYQYARLGLRALLLAKRLRKLTGMPSSRLDKYDWSPQKILWQSWREGRKFRNEERLDEE
ncbi:hypothetical protein JY446_23705 [Serratia marcescens]|uniref:hypothetical protein n=1 Tax=Serratia TaxID=613 RepID=UPI001008BA7A|nr:MULTISPECIES: hypothetical protein [Serratia]MBN5232344.1 hypothetical protein [Serratia marcescens]MDX6804198.1 hypothetical protein [Serratia marcescens]MDX6909069.1 hypothetical protein [Serratia marcescens]RXG74159.1 hypothetical protein D4G80_24105 [Serratia marcescens]RXG74373.1 hypothetical protein D5F12_24115 [Serratia marcescens]